MISSLRNFAKTKIAGIFVFIIIIPFVFWGMGSVFNSGNTNNIAKINDKSISTQDFMNYLNQSGLSTQVIKENLDKNIIEELLSALISTTLLDLEIKDLELSISKEILIKKIQTNKDFLDENGIFQRTLYEKFLLLNNTSAPIFEARLKNNELKKKLFNYIGGGIQAPKFFVNKMYKEQNKKLDINYINLNNFYRKKDTFTDSEKQTFINDNADKLKKDYIDFSYIKITPKNLLGLDEFNQNFFDKIDEIENEISKNVKFNLIINDLGIKAINKIGYINVDNKKTIENLIYNSRNNKIELLEDNGVYILYQINNIKTKLPNLSDNNFKKQIKDLLYNKKKYEFNKEILEQINNKTFNQLAFNKLGGNLIQDLRLNSVKDFKKFEKNSVEILYALPINSFTLITDDKDNIYIAKIVNFNEENIIPNSNEFDKFNIETNAKNKNNILKSYDYFLNEKYKVTVNQKTLDRVKNYFKWL